ncbi:hypothetical protein OG863_09810 [Streptomyces decoyicus]|uniref:Tyr recombinase domain-containing protein n=1 Tax=Streptomyces decoyicus TaxID=249567 RepID=A0ABZ1FD07_9ACTN|nr:hypothetical protein [Streptomyces decoyicus]WSB68227.1 hypothetical protein OG863_09810 [Streptomyces decoyicus]
MSHTGWGPAAGAQAPPLLVEHLVKISAACPDNLRGIRDRALVLMQFAVAGREHELAFNRVRGYAETPGGIQADLRVSKVRPRNVPVPYDSRPSICPVRAWQAWKEAASLTDPDGYTWRRLHTVMEGGLQPPAIGDVVTRAGERAGIEIRFTDHSPRRGLATSSRLKGHDQIVIAKQGGWAPTPRSSPATLKSSTSGRTTPCSACCSREGGSRYGSALMPCRRVPREVEAGTGSGGLRWPRVTRRRTDERT